MRYIIDANAFTEAARRDWSENYVLHNVAYSSVIAFSGQAVIHTLQFLQLSVLTNALPFSITMVPLGQISMQMPQAVHFSGSTLGN